MKTRMTLNLLEGEGNEKKKPPILTVAFWLQRSNYTIQIAPRYMGIYEDEPDDYRVKCYSGSSNGDPFSDRASKDGITEAVVEAALDRCLAHKRKSNDFWHQKSGSDHINKNNDPADPLTVVLSDVTIKNGLYSSSSSSINRRGKKFIYSRRLENGKLREKKSHYLDIGELLRFHSK